MPKTLFKVDLTKPMSKQDLLPQPLAPGHPDGGLGQARRRVPGRVHGLDGRADQATTTPPTTSRIVDLTKVHYLSGPIGVEGAEPGDLLVVDILDVGVLPDRRVGLHRHLRQGERRRLPDRALSRGAQGHAGTSAASTPTRATSRACEFAGIMHPGLIGCAAVEGAARHLEQAREGARSTPTPEPRPAAGGAAQRRRRAHMGRMKGRRGQGGRARRRAHRAAARARRQLRHQEPVARLDGLLPGLREGRRPLDGRHPLLAGRRRDHLLRRDRDGRATSTCTSSSSRAAWRSTGSSTRSSSPARSSRTTPST